MEHEGLEILRRTREKTGIGIVTEVMDTEQVDIVAETADMVQIGTRNMQNFSLLKKVAGCNRPVLLTRHVGNARRMADGGRILAGWGK